MFAFYLDNTNDTDNFIGCIAHQEESLLYYWYDNCDDNFIKKLVNQFYDDPSFSLNELTNAHQSLFKLTLTNHLSEYHQEVYFLYKLIAIISYAILKKQSLCCLSD